MDTRCSEGAPNEGADEAAGGRNSPSLVDVEAGVGPPDTDSTVTLDTTGSNVGVLLEDHGVREDSDDDEDTVKPLLAPMKITRTPSKGSRNKPPLMGMGGSYQFMPIQQVPVVLLPQVYGKTHNYGSASAPHHSDLLSPTNLYIRGLPESCTDKHLEEMCKGYGKITSTKSILDKKTNLCKGYGFVDFDRHCDAQSAVQALQGKGVLAQFAKLQEQDSTNLYMSNLPKSYNEENIESLLAPFGTITSTRVLRENRVSKGVGFARMSSQDSCKKAIAALSGQTLPGATEPLKIKLADLVKKKGYDPIFSPSNLFAVPSEYVYESPVLAQNGYSSSRMYSTQNLVPTSPYIQPGNVSNTQVSGYQVQGNHSIGWPGYYSQNSTGGSAGTELQGLAAHMSHLQINTGASSHHTHYQAGLSSAATGTPAAAIPPGHTAQYTQQPPGWTISPTATHYHIAQQ